MSDYTHETYGERVASVYDDFFPTYDPHAITALAEIAKQGRALELAIGTGRVALPLSAAGVDVQGVDIAPAMVEKLKAKPGGERIAVTLGNFAKVPVTGAFDLIYIVFNSFFALLTQEEQVECFRNAAQHLSPQGAFVLEVFVPDLRRFTNDQVNWVTGVTTDALTLDAGKLDSAKQHITNQRVVITEGKIKMYPLQIRYAWPAELDLMGQLAGLRLRERWGGWQKEAFNAECAKHISVYELAEKP